MRYLVRSGGLLGYAALVREAGGDPLRLLDEAGLPAAALDTTELYLSYPALADLYALTAGRLRMPAFGLRLGQRQSLEVVGALGAWLCHQATLGDALQGIRSHLAFHARGIDITLGRDADSFTLTLAVAFADRVPCMQLLTLSATLLAQGFHDLLGQPTPPLAVSLGFARPDAGFAQACEATFRCPVDFGSGRYQLRYPMRLLSAPVAVREPLRQRLLSHWRDGRALAAPLSMTAQAERAIAALLPTGSCRLEMVAALVGRHPRTLQQDLRTEGTRFDQVLRQVREQLACAHLADSDTDLTRLALDLGYAELAVFSRAFRQWTGLSPSAWRRQAATTTAMNTTTSTATTGATPQASRDR